MINPVHLLVINLLSLSSRWSLAGVAGDGRRLAGLCLGAGDGTPQFGGFESIRFDI